MSRLNLIEFRRHTARNRPLLVTSEFVLDGRLLLEHCERSTKQTYDFVSPIGGTLPDYHLEFVERLLLRRPSILPSGRRELLVCPECADLGCGCISAMVLSDGDCFIWDKLGYENNYDPESLLIFPMGRFVISKAELLHQLRGHVPDFR